MNRKVIEGLKNIDQGDEVRLVIDGEEYDGHAIEAYYKPWERDQWGGIDGEVIVGLELANDTVEKHDLPTHQLSISAREVDEDEWELSYITVWDPVVEDGTVIEDDYRSIGDLGGVEVISDAK